MLTRSVHCEPLSSKWPSKAKALGNLCGSAANIFALCVLEYVKKSAAQSSTRTLFAMHFKQNKMNFTTPSQLRSFAVLVACFHMFYWAEWIRQYDYWAGFVLFKSETNRVDVTFRSDDSSRATGFTLDVRSVPCIQWAGLSKSFEVFTNSPQHKNGNIAICVLAVPFQIYWTIKISNSKI